MTTEHIDYIAEAIKDSLGDRCEELSDGCPTCEAWKQYDDLRAMPEEPHKWDIASYQRKAPNGSWVNVDHHEIEHYAAKGQKIRALVTLRQTQKYIHGEWRKVAELKRKNDALKNEILELKTSLYIKEKANEALSRSVIESIQVEEKLKADLSTNMGEKELIGYFNGTANFTGFGHALLFLTNDKRGDNSVPLYVLTPSENTGGKYGRE